MNDELHRKFGGIVFSKAFSWRKQISKFIKYKVLRRKKRREKDWLKEKKRVLEEASKIFPHNIPLDVTKRNGVYIFHDKGNSLIRRGTSYEPEVQHTLMVFFFLDKLRGKSTVFADIGANIGLHTFFVKSQCKDLNIIAFDPSPVSWKYMELSIRYNNLSNIRLEKIALSETNGLLDFYNWGNESSGDSLKDTKRVLNVTPNIIKVPAKKLDDIKDIPPITVIKMDCEGAELSILKGARESLSINRPLILLEFHPINKAAFNVTTEDIFCFLKETNYSLYSINFEMLNFSMFDELQKQCEENYIMLPNKWIADRVLS
ncbi:MAG: FkbM family methyltransferase [Sedimentisphaerales bacterium]